MSENKKTMLEVAREYGNKGQFVRHPVTDETIELSLAWARGEIGIKSINAVMGKLEVGGGSAAYSLLARSLAEHIRRLG